MGLIFPEAETGFREGLYNGGFLGEMIQWMDILTALNSFQKIVMDFEKYRALRCKAPLRGS